MSGFMFTMASSTSRTKVPSMSPTGWGGNDIHKIDASVRKEAPFDRVVHDAKTSLKGNGNNLPGVDPELPFIDRKERKRNYTNV